ncbi:tRNA (uridine(54)-C5)-methyltransferase TrmA [Rodentibacter pneumotropicus]|uniref:tRNA/tmRNA (uracil-C(5))-methyltransferase n=1 Tax=Rodentibacter pneumotropicus TaxID=758 RepID=A0A4S2PG22_9PAST|nr:tRNA (uridine(54)-C5)-methyltransferase TrmA [Rodentibacter pneumotropicus]THA01175.1 tRNA (uridine(54)-C5)-methyltransferase TrmA [Rodentibacter pneumotropicus]THA02291.1 tRNA (uridine(54)-C5)-methyltransferase TrmA [Rodentibacter pneumotropicus]THA06098.1 tRNA (uridine(54)-C5)-methyltransferase TrmA [Rodentibacter pneumotropicus]THA15347.1 tRNA (uridine(54)-C5)-methyltransferase TrmA [Rodentibacter pneumotropicus]
MQLPVSQYTELLQKKQEKLTALLRPFNGPTIQVFDSPISHYRMRSEFRIWHEQDDFYHIMFDQSTRKPYRVGQFPIASRLINQMMQTLLPLLKQQEILHKKLFQIDYLSTLSNQIIVSLLYHKPLTEGWQQAAEKLRGQLIELGFDVQLIGRASKQKICLNQDYVDEILPVAGRNYVYRQVENSFTQPNAVVNCKMLEWAIDCTTGSEGDLLELYCGNGNFSIALAQNFRKVLATEIAKPSVAAAQFNIAENNVNNLQIIRMSAEEFTQAMNGVRAFNRLKGIDLTAYECNTIFVDPPRAGLDPDTVKLVQGYDRILYISCNPHTLCDNLQELSKTHRIEKAALFDQFPYTEHMESGVWLIHK